MLNRKYSEIAALKHKMDKADNSNRKARTRTLIQLGGILSLSGIPELLDIQEGEDLQFDHEARNKVATLLGMLAELMEDIDLDSNQQHWQQKGINILKAREYQR